MRLFVFVQCKMFLIMYISLVVVGSTRQPKTEGSNFRQARAAFYLSSLRYKSTRRLSVAPNQKPRPKTEDRRPKSKLFDLPFDLTSHVGMLQHYIHFFWLLIFSSLTLTKSSFFCNPFILVSGNSFFCMSLSGAIDYYFSVSKSIQGVFMPRT